MALQTNLNVPPYHDDYNEVDNYYQYLFKPGFPIQARELTGMQSMIQNQISTLAERFMKDGDNVVPGEFGLSSPVSYVRVSSITQGATPAEFIGYTFTGVTSGVQAECIFAVAETEADDITFYVQYTNSGNDSNLGNFIEGETLTTNTPNFYTAAVGLTGVSKPITSPPTGAGSLFDCREGYFYIDGYMVRSTRQTIVIGKYTTKESAIIGFRVDEDIVNSTEDNSLLDNATGYSNFAAPGADRMKISLVLTSIPLNSTLPNFIKLCTVVSGNVQGTPGDTVKWDWLYDILAKRTFEESGDYIVSDFALNILSYPNNLGTPDDLDVGIQTYRTERGLFNVGPDGQYPPVPGSGSTQRLTLSEAEEKYVIEISAGTAYVQGYRVSYLSSVYLFGQKALDKGYRSNTTTTMTQGYNFGITHVYGTPDFANISGAAEAQAIQQVTLYRNFGDGFVGEKTRTTTDLEPINYGNAPLTTYHIVCASSLDAVTDSAYTVIYKAGNSAVVTGATALVRGSTYGGVKVLISTKIDPIPAGVMTPRYLTPRDLVDDQDGNFGYNSTYNLGIVSSTFFQQIPAVDTANTSLDWVVGDLVQGDVSRATGVVELGTTKTDAGVWNLIVSNVQGQFRNGESITQGTGATQKVARILAPGETFGFEFYTGAGGSTSGSTDLSGNTYVDVTTLGATIRLSATADITATADRIYLTEAGRAKLVNFPFPQGSVLAVERIDLQVTAEDGSKGFALLLPGALTNTLTRTKSAFANLAGFDKFSADISSETTADSEIVRLADNSLFTGKVGDNFIECDNFSGNPSRQLGLGDVVTFVDDNGLPTSKLVFFATAPVGRSDARAKARVYFTTTLNAAITGKTVQRIRVLPKGKTTQNLLFQLPQDVVYSLETNQDATGIDYEIYKEFIINISESNSGNAGEFTLEAGNPSSSVTSAITQFLDDPNQITIAAIRNLSDAVDAANITGRQLTIDQNYNEGQYRRGILLNNDATSITIRLDYINIPACTIKVLIPMTVRNAISKRKVLKKDVELTIDAATSEQLIIPLGLADVRRLKRIYDANNLDITFNYRLDDGQRDNMYTVSRLILLEDKPRATGPIKVTVDYYEHEGEGDFFSVNSYTGDGSTAAYSYIPWYSPKSGAIQGAQFTPTINVALRDCLDFRPVVNTLDTGTGSNPSELAIITAGLCAQGNLSGTQKSDINFLGGPNGGNAFVPNFPVPQSRFECNIEYYLPRIDSVFLTNTGELKLQQGVSADNPQPNPDLATGIRLYDLFIPPFTPHVGAINTKKYNYKRFRMKDIATLERRLDRVEELVTLSILEQSVLNMQVRDAVTGLDRFKNGIVVDNFRGHGKGLVGSTQYRNSIDGRYTYLRSPCFVQQVQLEEKATIKTERDAENYSKSSDGIATLNYTEDNLVFNPYATRWINLQHFQVFCYDGSMELSPSIDTFYDITRSPELVIEDNNLHNAMVNLTDFMEFAGIGTTWGEWEDTGRVTTEVNTVTQSSGGSRVFIGDNRAEVLAQFANNRSRGMWGTGTATFIEQGATTISIENTTTTTEQARVQTQSVLDVQAGSIVNTSYGDRVTDVSLARNMRFFPVAFTASRTKPNTRYYAFFDGVPVDEYVSPDSPTPGTEFPDGLSRADQPQGTRQKGFGEPIISDDLGNVTGVFLVPAGRAPVQGTVFTSLEEQQFQTTGPVRTFITGTKAFRLTSNPTNPIDIGLIEGYAEANFTAAGVIADKQETVVSTRMSEFNRQQFITDSQTRDNVSTVQTGVDIEIGTIRTVTETIQVRNPLVDPVSQSFHIDKEFQDGVFVTSVETFFKSKDPILPVECYLVTTDGFVVTNEIMPHGKIVVPSDTTLRTNVTLPTGVDTITIPAGTEITGSTSGATGIIKSELTFNSPAINTGTNVENTTYNVILNNYNGTFVEGENFTVLTIDQNVERSTFTIALDTYVVDRIEITNFGSGYSQPDTTVDGETATTITLSAPELLGGVTATASCQVSLPNMPTSGTTTIDGLVYSATLLTPGSGYTKTPSVTISGDGTGATAVARLGEVQKAVIMGVAITEDASVPTKFVFPAPVYMLPDTWYGFTCRAPETKKYEMYTSKLGENILGTTTRVIEQPNLGSMFSSQDGGLWTEDQMVDVKFNVYRAEFEAGAVGRVTLQNAPIETQTLTYDPIEVSSEPAANADDTAFGTNPRIIKFVAQHHGLVPGDYVAIRNAFGTGTPATIGGIPLEEINTLHQVVDVGMDVFTVMVSGTGATSTVSGGGGNVLITPNIPYEVANINTGAQVFGSSTFIATSRTTQAEAVTGYNAVNKYTLDVPVNIELLDSYYFNEPKVVPSHINQIKYNDVFHMSGQRGYETVVTMSTTNSAVSPVLDLIRTQFTSIRNLIDNPKPDDDIYGGQITTVTLKDVDVSAISLTAGSNFTFTTDSVSHTAKIKEYNATTKRIVLEGQRAANLKLASTFSDAAVQAVGGNNVVTSDGVLFVPETDPNGTTYSKWISRTFEFENACDGIELKTTTIFYGDVVTDPVTNRQKLVSNNVKAYYKPRNIGFDTEAIGEAWVPFNQDGLPNNVEQIVPRSSADVDPRRLKAGEWQALTWSIQDIPQFDAVSIKLVMTADNPALAPIIDDFMLVCTE